MQIFFFLCHPIFRCETKYIKYLVLSYSLLKGKIIVRQDGRFVRLPHSRDECLWISRNPARQFLGSRERDRRSSIEIVGESARESSGRGGRRWPWKKIGREKPVGKYPGVIRTERRRRCSRLAFALPRDEHGESRPGWSADRNPGYFARAGAYLRASTSPRSIRSIDWLADWWICPRLRFRGRASGLDVAARGLASSLR